MFQQWDCLKIFYLVFLSHPMFWFRLKWEYFLLLIENAFVPEQWASFNPKFQKLRFTPWSCVLCHFSHTPEHYLYEEENIWKERSSNTQVLDFLSYKLNPVRMLRNITTQSTVDSTATWKRYNKALQLCITIMFKAQSHTLV